MKYQIVNPDDTLSPYTGMSKVHWLSACEFLLTGIFNRLADEETPITAPRQEYRISYPNAGTSKWKEYAARFEGLARSFLIAAPLLHNNPAAVISGYSVKEVYKRQILNAVTKGKPGYMLSYPEVQALAAPGEQAFQHTCECASLVIGLWQCREVIWQEYSREEKARICHYLQEYGNGRTVPHNWRLFNMLILAFLHMEGYEIDEDLMRDHGQVILSYYAGDGWYRDGHRFDYYSPWAFHVYGPLWNVWYGYEKEPYIAGKIEAYTNALMGNYEGMFDKEGHVTLWGRSGIYRNAAAAPFAAAFLLKKPQIEPGLARRICSGSLLQFITREEVFHEGVPTLGFYGQFTPMLQDYSCAESPFWLANPFLCLCFPDDHPFWTEIETAGAWENIDKRSFKEAVIPGPGIVTTLHGGNGSAEFRTGKVLFEPGDSYIKCYSRLSFHSQYPWEDFDFQDGEGMQYSLLYKDEEKTQLPNIILYSGYREGILYRKEYFDFGYNFQGAASIDLADFPTACGIVRVDKMRIPERPYELFMGAYGFPKLGEVTITEIAEEKNGGTRARAFVIRDENQALGMSIYTGFDSLHIKERHGVNPVSRDSLLIYGKVRREKYYDYNPYVLISAIVTKKGKEDFTNEELFPVSQIDFTDARGCGGFGPIRLVMKDGRRLLVDYNQVEGSLMI